MKNKKNKNNWKFFANNSYKRFTDFKSNQNKINHVWETFIKVFKTIKYMFSYKKIFGENIEIDLFFQDHFLNKVYKEKLINFIRDLRYLLWLRFCVEMRSLIEYLNYFCSRNEYKNIKNEILKTKFLSYFINNKNSLSFPLHNYSEIEFFNNKDKCWETLDKSFNEAFNNNDIKSIKNEFERILFLFFKIDDKNSPSYCVELDNNFPIIDFVDFLIKQLKIKK